MTRKKAVIIVSISVAILFLAVNIFVVVLEGIFSDRDAIPVYIETPDRGNVGEDDAQTQLSQSENNAPDNNVLSSPSTAIPGTRIAWIDDPTRESDFPRVDFAAIDFASLVLPTTTPHGYIGHAHVQYLSRYLPERIPFTYRELDTALWIVHMLHAKGFCPSLVELQTFSHYDVNEYLMSSGWTMERLEIFGWFDGHEQRDYSQNVIVTIPGRSQSLQTIIIGAHYDGVHNPGASDNASGTALLLENAQRMREMDNYYTLVYVFFGAEEIGLTGAFYYYASLSQTERDNILFMVNADVLLDGPDVLYAAGYIYGERWGQARTNYLTDRIDYIAAGLNDQLSLNLTPWHDGVTLSTDQLVFAWEGHSVVVFWGAELIAPSQFSPYGGFNMQVLHSPRDCYDYMSVAFPGRVAEIMGAFSIFLEAILLD